MYYVNEPDHSFMHPFPPYGWVRPQFPEIDTSLFGQSADETKKLMDDAGMIIDMLRQSDDFRKEVMQAAQMSQHDKVKHLMASTGIASDVTVQFNPDGLQLIFKSQINNKDCCKLAVNLRWR